MRLRHENRGDEILLLDRRAGDPPAAAPLLAVRGERNALDITALAQCDDTRLIGNQVLDVDLTLHRHDVGAAHIAALAGENVLGLEVGQIVFDQAIDFVGRRQQILEVRNTLAERFELGFDLFALQPSKLVEAHIEDGVNLLVRKLKARHQAGLGLVTVLRGADDGDHFVQMIQRDKQPVQNVLARLSLVQLKAGAARQHVKAVIHMAADHLLERHDLGTSPVDRQHDRAESALELGMLVEVVEHDLSDRAALQLNHHADAVTRALIADVGDALDDLLIHQVSHPLDHRRLVHHVGNLGDDDRLFVLVLDDLGLAAHHERTTPKLVHRLDTALAADDPAGREVRPFDELHQLVDRAVWIVHIIRDAVDQLTQIVRRDVGGHADRDTRGTVHQQIGQARRQDHRLLLLLIVVRAEVDRVLVEVGQHLLGQPVHAAFGVTHGGSRVAVDRSKVALAIHQRVAHGKVLRQTNERIINGAVAVGMVFTHRITDHARGLLVGLVVCEP